MLKKLLLTAGFGIFWLFIFSIPIDRERRIFDVGYATLIDTQAVHWVLNKVQNYFVLTKKADVNNHF